MELRDYLRIMRRRWLMIVSCVVVAVAVSACRNRNQVVVPNRVLDRPLDVALACVRRSGDGVEVLSLNVCDGASVGDCTDGPQLVGFVTNSERNEVAMFRQCDRNGLVDLARGERKHRPVLGVPRHLAVEQRDAPELTRSGLDHPRARRRWRYVTPENSCALGREYNPRSPLMHGMLSFLLFALDFGPLFLFLNNVMGTNIDFLSDPNWFRIQEYTR